MQRVAFLIIGGGLASAKAAEALRAEGAQGEIVLLSRDADRPYHRPPLSKDFLRGETQREDVFVHPADWAQQHQVEVRLGTTVERLDVAGRTATLAGGETLGFARLLLATGAEPRPLPVPGAEQAGVRYLRTLRDAEQLQQAAKGKQRAVLIGGGFIGAEVAASLRQLRLETVLVAREAVLWSHLFGPELAAVFGRTLRDHGVQVHAGEEVARLDGSGAATRVVTKRGRSVEADLVVVGAGVRPVTDLARDTPLTVDNGLVTDQHLATDQPGIYAAGDVANFFSPLYQTRMRVEHWDVAQQHGEIAGKNLAREAAGKPGERQAYDQPPYFFSDLFDLSMEFLGYNQGFDDALARGDSGGREFTGFFLKGSRLVAALFVNRNPDVEPVRTLLQQRLTVDAAIRRRLQDPNVDLASLAGERE